MGVGISGLAESTQLELDFSATAPGGGEEKRRHLDEAEDAIVERFGRNALARARTLLASAAEDTASLEGRPRLPDPPRE